MDMLTIFEFSFLTGERVPEKSPLIDQIVELVNKDQQKIIMKIMKMFSNIGYSNIWA